MGVDGCRWPRCLLWHGWLPLLSGVTGDSLWGETACKGAGNMLEHILGTQSSRLLFDWSLPDEFDAADASLRLLDKSNVWTDGSLVLDEVSGDSSSGSGFYADLPGQVGASR